MRMRPPSLTWAGVDQVRPPSSDLLTTMGRPVWAKQRMHIVAWGFDWSQAANRRPVLGSATREVWKVWGPAILVGSSKFSPPSPERVTQNESGELPGPLRVT